MIPGVIKNFISRILLQEEIYSFSLFPLLSPPFLFFFPLHKCLPDRFGQGFIPR
jgi:hypothetical protein